MATDYTKFLINDDEFVYQKKHDACFEKIR